MSRVCELCSFVNLRVWYFHGRCGCCIVVNLVSFRIFWILRTHEFVRFVRLCLLWWCGNVVLWSLWKLCECELVHVSSFAILWICLNSELREFVRLWVSIMLCNCENCEFWDLWILWIIRNCNLEILWTGWLWVLCIWSFYEFCGVYYFVKVVSLWRLAYCEILHLWISRTCDFCDVVEL